MNFFFLIPIFPVGCRSGDIRYTWIFGRGKFSLLIWASFISQFVHPMKGEGMGYRRYNRGGYQYFRTASNKKSGATSK